VQACRWCSYRTFLYRVDGLIPLFVKCNRLAFQVGRERCLAEQCDYFGKGNSAIPTKFNQSFVSVDQPRFKGHRC
jgi:hypothetical protein